MNGIRAGVWTAVVMGSLVAALPAKAQAAEAEPFAFVTVSSVERLREEAGYFLELAGQPQLLHMADYLVEQAGLSRSRPLVVTVAEGVGLPAVRVFVPTRDVTKLLTVLQSQFPEQEELGQGLYRVSGRRTVFARTGGEDTVFSLSREALEGELRYPRSAVKLAGRFNVAFSVEFQKIPQQYRQLAQMAAQQRAARRGGQQGSRPTPPQAELADPTTVSFLTTLLNEADTFTYGMRLSKDDRNFVYETRFTALPGSELAGTLAGMKTTSRLNNLLDREAPLNFAVNAPLPEVLLDYLRTQWETASTRQRERLETGSVGSDGKSELKRKLLEATGDLTAECLREGRLQLAVSLGGPADGPYSLFGAVRVPGCREFLGRVDEAIRESGTDEMPKELSWNVAEHEGLPIHRIEAPIADRQAKRFFGERTALSFAGDADTLYFAFGGASEPHPFSVLKRTIETAGPDAGAVNAPAAWLQVRAGRWSQMLPEGGHEEEFSRMARQILVENDRFTFLVAAAKRGMTTRVTLEEDYLRLLAKAFSQGFERSMERKTLGRSAPGGTEE